MGASFNQLLWNGKICVRLPHLTGWGSKLAAPPTLFARRRRIPARPAQAQPLQLARRLRAYRIMSVALLTIFSFFKVLPDRVRSRAGQKARAGGQGLPGAAIADASMSGGIAGCR